MLVGWGEFGGTVENFISATPKITRMLAKAQPQYVFIGHHYIGHMVTR
jgi:hypothetical protein